MSEPELGAVAWDRCPADVLLSVISHLDISSIAQCYSVNQWWRNMVDYWAQHNDKWNLLASEMIPNYGSTFFQKSLLGWKELYCNYLLWHNVEKAELKYDSQLTFDGIHYLHIYKDLLTVVHNGKGYESNMSMIKIKNDSGFEPAVKTKEPSTDLMQAMINAGPFKRIAYETDQALSDTDDMQFYTLTADNNIAYNSWDLSSFDDLFSEPVCSYYGCDESLDDIQLVENFKDAWQRVICLYMKNATAMFLDCSMDRIGRSMRGCESYNRPHFMMNAEKIFRPTAMAQLLFDPRDDFEFTRERAQKERKHDDDGTDDEDDWMTESESGSGSSYDDPFSDSSESVVEVDKQLEADCLTVYKSGKRFVGLSLNVEKHQPYSGYSRDDMSESSEDTGSITSGDAERAERPFIARCVRWVGCDRNLRSATQHGDMLLLGYQDGKIEIHKVNFEVVADTSPAKLVFNIKDYVPKEPNPNNTKEDYRVMVIEVFEMKDSHCLLIATPNRLYRIAVTYPESVTRSVGARNAEKAMTTLARWRAAQVQEAGGQRERRPFLASECNDLPQAEKWRLQIVREIAKKVAQIQNAGLGEFRIRDLNDEINKLMREKRHWEVQIKSLGGPDHARIGPRMLDQDGKEVPGNRGYKYFGAAKDLPGVRELFEQEPPPPPRRTRADLMRDVDADYYGYRDDDDGLLIPLELHAEKEAIARAVEEWKRNKELNKDEDLPEEENIYPEDPEDKRIPEDDDANLTSHVAVPSQRDVEEALLRRKKQELLERYGCLDVKIEDS